MTAALTCEHCLRGRTNRCAGPGRCALWKTTAPSTPPMRRPKRRKRPKPKVVQRQRRAPGERLRGEADGEPRLTQGPPHGLVGVAREVQHAVALDLLNTWDKMRVIAERHGVTYEQVRTVKRNLEVLNGERRRRQSPYAHLSDEQLQRRYSSVSGKLDALRAELERRAA